jgi:hypothetical protein
LNRTGRPRARAAGIRNSTYWNHLPPLSILMGDAGRNMRCVVSMWQAQTPRL